MLALLSTARVEQPQVRRYRSWAETPHKSDHPRHGRCPEFRITLPSTTAAGDGQEHRVPAAVSDLVFLSGGLLGAWLFERDDVSYPWVTPGPSRTRRLGWTADLLGTPSYFAFEQIRVIFLSWPLSGFALQSGNGLCFRTGATVCGQARGAAASVPGPRTPVADGFGPIHT